MVKKKHDFREMISKAVPYDGSLSFIELFFVPSGRKHPDSGYGLFTIYGSKRDGDGYVFVKICDCPDVISIPTGLPLSLEEEDGIVGIFSFSRKLTIGGEPFTSTFSFGIGNGL